MMAKVKIYVIIFLFIFSNYGYCFDEEVTHPNLTMVAIDNSNLGAYLKRYLMFNGGVDSEIQSNSKTTIRSLLGAGSTEEDHPNCTEIVIA